jgi:hypothetical protein
VGCTAWDWCSARRGDRSPQAKPENHDGAERIGAAKSTYLKVDKGSVGLHAMMLFVLGFGDAIGELVDLHRDDVGLSRDAQRLAEACASKNRRPL